MSYLCHLIITSGVHWGLFLVRLSPLSTGLILSANVANVNASATTETRWICRERDVRKIQSDGEKGENEEGCCAHFHVSLSAGPLHLCL